MGERNLRAVGWSSHFLELVPLMLGNNTMLDNSMTTGYSLLNFASSLCSGEWGLKFLSIAVRILVLSKYRKICFAFKADKRLLLLITGWISPITGQSLDKMSKYFSIDWHRQTQICCYNLQHCILSWFPKWESSEQSSSTAVLYSVLSQWQHLKRPFH